MTHPDKMLLGETWSDLRSSRELPEIDKGRLLEYRLKRIRNELKAADAAMCILVSPISLRYAVDYRTYGLFQSHIPTTYLFLPVDGPSAIYGAYGTSLAANFTRKGRPLSVFDGGNELSEAAPIFARDVVDYLREIGQSNRRVAVEYVNPSITQALERAGLEVIDGVLISERARTIKSPDEISCMRWAGAVAEHGIAKMREALSPGVTELQLWGLLNYTNLANDGDWHEGRMLASGPRINPWLQEATQRRIEAGDLIGFDTDMVGPFGYFADISRTFHCGPARPSQRQKQLYRLAVAEIEHNLRLVRPGASLEEIRRNALVQPEEYHENAYSCIMHGVGMADEYPQIKPSFRSIPQYNGKLEIGMVICVESYVGAKGERDGVKLEQQVLVTAAGYELLSTYPLEESLLD